MSFWKTLIRNERPSGVVKAVPFVSQEEREGRAAYHPERRTEITMTEHFPEAAWDSALEPVLDPNADNIPEGRLALLDIDLIDSNPYQPRRTFDNERLVELAASIVEFGVLQPIIVCTLGDRYQLIAGERRTKAARLAGLQFIPAIVREMDNDRMAMLSLIENLQREDLNVIDEAHSYARLISEFKLTQEELARQLGRSQSSIANKLRLLRLPPLIQEALGASLLTERHARALLRLATPEQQMEAQELILHQGMNVRQCEEWVEAQLNQMNQQKEDAEETAETAAPKRVRRFIPKNLLLFLNEFKRVVKTMQEAGIETEYGQEEEDDYWTVTVKIRKM